MLEGENRQTEIGEHASLTNESQRSHRLLHGDLRDCRQVEMTVMRHHNSVEQDRHDS